MQQLLQCGEGIKSGYLYPRYKLTFPTYYMHPTFRGLIWRGRGGGNVGVYVRKYYIISRIWYYFYADGMIKFFGEVAGQSIFLN